MPSTGCRTGTRPARAGRRCGGIPHPIGIARAGNCRRRVPGGPPGRQRRPSPGGPSPPTLTTRGSPGLATTSPAMPRSGCHESLNGSDGSSTTVYVSACRTVPSIRLMTTRQLTDGSAVSGACAACRSGSDASWSSTLRLGLLALSPTTGCVETLIYASGPDKLRMAGRGCQKVWHGSGSVWGEIG